MLKDLIHPVVLRTRRVPGLSALYRGIYEGAAARSARSLAGLDGVRGVSLHRGMSRDAWEPGVSDIDLILLRDELSAGEEGGFLAALEPEFARLKNRFPMLGDLWIAEEEELHQYLRWGGFRVWEDVRSWRRLAGDGPTAAASGGSGESPRKRRWLDPWVWVFAAFMEISRRRFCGRGGMKEAADAAKLLLDMRRYWVLLEAEGALPDRPLPRGEAAGLGPAPPDLPGLWLEAASLLDRASRRVLEKLECRGSRTAAFPRAEEALRPALEAFGCCCERVVWDPPYHSYLILPSGSGEKDYLHAADELDRSPAAGVPLVLGREAWGLCLQSSYLGAPIGALADAGEDFDEGGLFADWHPRSFGGENAPIPVLEPRLRWETAAEAASWMALWWRFLWADPSWDSRFVLYHLYSRLLGLRLELAGGAPGAFSSLARLIGEAKERFPGEGKWFESLERFRAREPLGCVRGMPRAALAPEHAEGISAQLRAVGELLRKGETSCPVR